MKKKEKKKVFPPNYFGFLSKSDICEIYLILKYRKSFALNKKSFSENDWENFEDISSRIRILNVKFNLLDLGLSD